MCTEPFLSLDGSTAYICRPLDRDLNERTVKTLAMFPYPIVFITVPRVIFFSPPMTFQPPGLQQPPRCARRSSAEFTRLWRPSPWCTTWRPCTRPTVWRTRPRRSSIMKTRAESTRPPAQMRYGGLPHPALYCSSRFSGTRVSFSFSETHMADRKKSNSTDYIYRYARRTFTLQNDKWSNTNLKIHIKKEWSKIQIIYKNGAFLLFFVDLLVYHIYCTNSSSTSIQRHTWRHTGTYLHADIPQHDMLGSVHLICLNIVFSRTNTEGPTG